MIIRSLQDYIKGTEKFIKEILKIEDNVLNKLASSTISKAKPLTPVDTGQLRNSFFQTKVKKDLKSKYIEVKNNAKHSTPVEFGHTTRNGGYVRGRFMLKKATRFVETKQLQNIIKNEIKRIERMSLR